MTPYQQDTYLFLTGCTLGLITSTILLLSIGWVTFLALWSILCSAGCLYSAYRILFSKSNLY